MPKFGVIRVALTAALLSLPITAFSAQPAPWRTVAAHTDFFSGRVTITTSADRRWVFITLAPKRPSLPLSGAFAAQYVRPLPSTIHFNGEARVRVAWTQGSGMPAPLSVLVMPKSDESIMFIVAGGGPPGVVVEHLPIGIAYYAIGVAYYTWPPKDAAAPRTAAAFVDYVADPCTKCG